MVLARSAEEAESKFADVVSKAANFYNSLVDAEGHDRATAIVDNAMEDSHAFAPFQSAWGSARLMEYIHEIPRSKFKLEFKPLGTDCMLMSFLDG